MKQLQIGARTVGEGCPVLVVAELSANHGARKEIALRTIDAAAAAGADAIKLQTYTPATLTLESSSDPFIVRTKNEWAGRTLHDLYAEAMTPWEWHAELKAHAEAQGLICFSTPFDVTAVEYLEQLGVLVHKVASFELTDLPLVEHIARRGHPMILSTGMASLGEIEAAVATCRRAGNDQLALLRCVSAYPAAPEAMALSSLRTLESFDVVIGLSDHTRDDTAAVAAVALGAKIVEKHFIVDRAIGGPDAFFSLDPEELTRLVRSIRAAERSIERPRFGPSADEVASLRFRRSLFVAKDIARGETITCDHVRSVRPSDGIAPEHLPRVLGGVATCDLAFATPLRWEHFAPAPSSDVVLREAVAADEPLLVQFAVPGASRDDNSRLLVAERGGEAVAAVRLVPKGTSADAYVYGAKNVDASCSIASVLRAVASAAPRHGFSHLAASIPAHDEATIGAYKAAGFYGFFTREAAGQTFACCERRLA